MSSIQKMLKEILVNDVRLDVKDICWSVGWNLEIYWYEIIRLLDDHSTFYLFIYFYLSPLDLLLI